MSNYLTWWTAVYIHRNVLCAEIYVYYMTYTRNGINWNARRRVIIFRNAERRRIIDDEMVDLGFRDTQSGTLPEHAHNKGGRR